MNLMTLILQIILTIPLTIILNYFQNKDSNRINQVLIPTIYTIIIAALIPSIKENIFLIVVFEIFIRNFYVTSIVNQKNKISNTMFITESIISIAISLFTYNYFIAAVDSVIPNPEEIKPFLWFLIIIYFVYLYNTSTKDKIPNRQSKALKLKNEQIIMQFAKFKNQYASCVRSKSPIINNLVYATMIYSDYKTPKLYRNIKAYIGAVTKKEVPYGIMQINSLYRLTDEESILKTVLDYEKALKNSSLKELEQVDKILTELNVEGKEEITSIYQTIADFTKK